VYVTGWCGQLGMGSNSIRNHLCWHILKLI